MTTPRRLHQGALAALFAAVFAGIAATTPKENSMPTRTAIPPIDAAVPATFQTATFALG